MSIALSPLRNFHKFHILLTKLRTLIIRTSVMRSTNSVELIVLSECNCFIRDYYSNVELPIRKIDLQGLTSKQPLNFGLGLK